MRKLKIVDHVTSCAACAEEFEFLYEIQQYQDQIIQSAGEIRTRKRSSAVSPSVSNAVVSFGKYASVAAGILLVVASLVYIIKKWDKVGDSRAVPSSVLLIEPNQNHLAFPPLVFKWREYKEATVYVLELFDEALLPLWKSHEIRTPNLTLPDGVRDKLQANRPYYWMVTAYRGGNKLAESELMRFTLMSRGR